MGGCRCTYRNCSLRTDGKTHMFHYPVFDKVRCHQWLTNAQKLEFLNLKVSQLRNRVVCQHHFKDEAFMNFKKAKLTFDAVPTEDGPYCDSSQLYDTKLEQDEPKIFSISLDDIENEYLTMVDKKANFSVKYGDFLTNCDVMDLASLSALNEIKDKHQIAKKGLLNLDLNPNVLKAPLLAKRSVKKVQPLTRKNRRKCFGNASHSILNNTTSIDNLTIYDNNTVDISKQSETQQAEHPESMKLILNVSHVPIEFEGTKSNDKSQQSIDQSFDVKVFDESKLDNRTIIDVKVLDESKLLNGQSIDTKAFDESELLNNQLFDESKLSNNNFNKSLCKEKKQIRIISEKRISEPVPLIGKLEPVSPTRVLTFPNKRRFFNLTPLVGSPGVPINSNIETTILEMDTSKDNNNIVVQKSDSELMKIISSRTDNVSPQKIRCDANIISYEVLPSNLSPQKIGSDVINQISNEVLHNNLSLQKKRSDVINQIPNEVLPNNVSLQKIRSDVNQISNEVLPNNVSLQKIRSDVNQISNEVLPNNVSLQKIRSDVINQIPNEVLPNNVSLQKIRSDVIHEIPNEVLIKTSLLKNKIPPERVAEIAEKRKFNMKLRDIVEDCLDNLDEPVKSDYDKREPSYKTKTMQSKKEQVCSYLAKEPELPSVQGYTIAYLEDRMKKMENILLNKIEENSQKIVELKQTYEPSCERKTVHTQTSVSEDVHKRQLYQELSKYLSQEANSLLYEELFINKYTKDVPKCSSPPKRRKRRR